MLTEDASDEFCAHCRNYHDRDHDFPHSEQVYRRWCVLFRLPNGDAMLTGVGISLGRKEIVLFFYLYAIIEALAIFLDSGIIPTASNVYPVRFSILTRLLTLEGKSVVFCKSLGSSELHCVSPCGPIVARL